MRGKYNLCFAATVYASFIGSNPLVLVGAAKLYYNHFGNVYSTGKRRLSGYIANMEGLGTNSSHSQHLMRGVEFLMRGVESAKNLDTPCAKLNF